MDRWIIIIWDDDQRRWKIGLDETTFMEAFRAYSSMKRDALVVKLVDVSTP